MLRTVLNFKMIQLLIIMGLAIPILLTPCLSDAQSAKEAFMALKKLEARTQVGVSYRDYSSALGEAKFPVNLFVESKEGRESIDLAKAIRKTFAIYSDALMVFGYKTTGGLVYGDNTEIGRYLLPKYPQLGKSISEKGARRPPSGAAYDLDSSSTLEILFNLAGQSLYDTEKLLSLSKSPSLSESSMTLENFKAENTKLSAEIDRLSKEILQLRTENDILKNLLKK
jgi:hypothetical protein